MYKIHAQNRTPLSNAVYGLEVDYENNTFTRLNAAIGRTAGTDFTAAKCWGGRRRCNVSNDGTITAYYGNANYIEDGSNGQVMVYQPKFYYRVEPVKTEPIESGIGYHLRKARYYVSDIPHTGFKLHPAFVNESGNEVDYILYSAYEGSMYDASENIIINDGTLATDITIAEGDMLCSVAGVKPVSSLKKNLTRTNFEAISKNRGAGWHLETIKAVSANQLLMIIEIGTMNTQSAIGQGIVSIPDNSSYNCASLTGSTSNLGNTTGEAAETINEIGGVETIYTTNMRRAVTYRGMENPYGNIWKHNQGINLWGNGTMQGGQPYISNNFVYYEYKHDGNYEPAGFTISNSGNYIKAMGYGTEEYDWLFMPSETGGTVDLPVGDSIYLTANLNGHRIAPVGGGWWDGRTAGMFALRCGDTGDGMYKGVGGRLMYYPQN